MKNFTFQINSEMLTQVLVDKLHIIETEIKDGLLEFGISTEEDLINLQYLIIFHTNNNFKDEVVINGKLMNAKELDHRLLVYGMALSSFYVAKFTLEHKPYSTFIASIFMAETFLFSLRYKLPLSSKAIEDIQIKHRNEIATKGALARIANDPRQLAKQYIFNCWEVWQEDPERYVSKADFAKEMLKLDICKPLKSQKKIEDWCRDFEKESSSS